MCNRTQEAVSERQSGSVFNVSLHIEWMRSLMETCPVPPQQLCRVHRFIYEHEHTNAHLDFSYETVLSVRLLFGFVLYLASSSASPLPLMFSPFSSTWWIYRSPSLLSSLFLAKLNSFFALFLSLLTGVFSSCWTLTVAVFLYLSYAFVSPLYLVSSFSSVPVVPIKFLLEEPTLTLSWISVDILFLPAVPEHSVFAIMFWWYEMAELLLSDFLTPGFIGLLGEFFFVCRCDFLFRPYVLQWRRLFLQGAGAFQVLGG